MAAGQEPSSSKDTAAINGELVTRGYPPGLYAEAGTLFQFISF